MARILLTVVTSLAAAAARNTHCLLTNFDNMYNPCVVETEGDYRYKMWFFGWAAASGNPGDPGVRRDLSRSIPEPSGLGTLRG